MVKRESYQLVASIDLTKLLYKLRRGVADSLHSPTHRLKWHLFFLSYQTRSRPFLLFSLIHSFSWSLFCRGNPGLIGRDEQGVWSVFGARYGSVYWAYVFNRLSWWTCFLTTYLSFDLLDWGKLHFFSARSPRCLNSNKFNNRLQL